MSELGTVNVALQLLPIAIEKPTLYKIVDECIQLINESGLTHKVSAFETTIEGGYDEVMALVKKVQLHCHKVGVNHLIANLKIQSDSTGVVDINDKIGKYQ